MNLLFELMAVALAALLSENFVMVSCMGVGDRTRSFSEPLDAIRTGYCLTAVMVLGALLSWLTDHLVLIRFGWEHFRLMAFSLLIPAIVEGLRWFIRTCLPELSRRMDGNLAAIPSNCAALGSALLISQRSMSLPAGLVFALFGGVGAALALVAFASLQSSVDLERCPRPFRGIPIKLITAGLMAMALVGFYGLNLHH